MRTRVCDICKKTERYCYYSLVKKWKLRRYDYDSQGGSWHRLDMCDNCFLKLLKMAKDSQ